VNKSTGIRIGHVARVVKKRNAYKNLIGKPEQNNSIMNPWHRLEYDIKMDLK
jgi:hypothetical protein